MLHEIALFQGAKLRLWLLGRSGHAEIVVSKLLLLALHLLSLSDGILPEQGQVQLDLKQSLYLDAVDEKMVLSGPLGEIFPLFMESLEVEQCLIYLDLPLFAILLQFFDPVLLAYFFIKIVLYRILHENLQHHFLFLLFAHLISFVEHFLYHFPLIDKFLLNFIALVYQLFSLTHHPLSSIHTHHHHITTHLLQQLLMHPQHPLQRGRQLSIRTDVVLIPITRFAAAIFQRIHDQRQLAVIGLL